LSAWIESAESLKDAGMRFRFVALSFDALSFDALATS
jgi:hypothetical protein